MKRNVIEIILHLILSVILSAAAFVGSSYNADMDSYSTLMSILVVVLLILHIFSLNYIKSNVVRTASYVIILPEVLLLKALFVWQPILAIAESTIIFFIMIRDCIIWIKRKKNNITSHSKKIKKFIGFINSRMVMCSIVLLPGYIYLMSCYYGHEVMMSVDSNFVADPSFSISEDEWKDMSVTEKSEVIAQITAIESKKLNLSETPQINISYFPTALYGGYSEGDNIITLNASVVYKGNALDTIETLLHELFHCSQYTLISNYDSLPDPKTEYSTAEILLIELYQYEFSNYKSGGLSSEEFSKYQYQICETTARDYASRAIETYVRDTT